MKDFSGFLVALALSGIASQSLAQDYKAQLRNSDRSFAGAYVGLGLGVASADGTTDYPVLSGGTRYAPYDPSDGNALSGFAGYNFLRGNVVYGAEIRVVNLTQLSQSDASEDREVMDLADIRGRLGHRFENWMVYGALGWSWAKFRVHPGSGFGERRNQTTLQGYNLALGVERILSDRWLLGGEIAYRDLNGRFDEASRDTDMNLSTISFRLSYKF
ncbi:MAG: outer membrane protein [Ruegeria sp.]